MADFFLGDQLTSQVFLFRNIQFMLCYYSSSSFLDRVNDRCDTKNPFSQLVYVFSMMPYWWRFLQVRCQTGVWSWFGNCTLFFCFFLIIIKDQESTDQKDHNSTWPYAVLEKIPRRGRHRSAVECWQVRLRINSCSGQNSIRAERNRNLVGFVHTLFMYCHALPALLGPCNWLGATSTSFPEPLASRPGHLEEEVSLLSFYGKMFLRTSVFFPSAPSAAESVI